MIWQSVCHCIVQYIDVVLLITLKHISAHFPYKKRLSGEHSGKFAANSFQQTFTMQMKFATTLRQTLGAELLIAATLQQTSFAW